MPFMPATTPNIFANLKIAEPDPPTPIVKPVDPKQQIKETVLKLQHKLIRLTLEQSEHQTELTKLVNEQRNYSVQITSLQHEQVQAATSEDYLRADRLDNTIKKINARIRANQDEQSELHEQIMGVEHAKCEL